MNNKTENKHTRDEKFKPDKLVSELRQKLINQTSTDAPKVPQVLPVHRAREEKEANEEEGETKEE